jgi:hypothetical protein
VAQNDGRYGCGKKTFGWIFWEERVEKQIPPLRCGMTNKEAGPSLAALAQDDNS